MKLLLFIRSLLNLALFLQIIKIKRFITFQF